MKFSISIIRSTNKGDVGDVEDQEVNGRTFILCYLSIKEKIKELLLKAACYANELLFVLIRCTTPPMGWRKNCSPYDNIENDGPNLLWNFSKIFKSRSRSVRVLWSRVCCGEGVKQFCTEVWWDICSSCVAAY